MGDLPFFKNEPLDKYYEIDEEIGSGQFAVVRRVVEKSTGIEYAGKFIRKKRSKAKAKGVTREAIEREGRILKISQHERIIYLHDAYENSDEFILILELLSGGELFDFLGDREYLTEEEAVDFTRQIVDAIYYLHENKVAHLDLKPENIVLKNPYDTAVKLVDFGLARQLRFGEQVREIMGTPEFVAPEVINFDPIGLFTDMWAIGVLTFILLSGASPFLGNNVQETFEYISAGEYDFEDEAFDSVSDDAKDFICRLLIQDVRRRMSARECLEHPWLNISLKKIRAINKFCMMSNQKQEQKNDSSSEIKRPAAGEIVLKPSVDEPLEPDDEPLKPADEPLEPDDEPLEPEKPKIPDELEEKHEEREKPARKKSVPKTDKNLVDEIAKETEDFRKAVRLNGEVDEKRESKEQRHESSEEEDDRREIVEPPREPSPELTITASDTPKKMKTPPPVKPKPRKIESQEELKPTNAQGEVSTPEMIRRKISKVSNVSHDEAAKEAHLPRAFVKSLVQCFASGTPPTPVEDVLISDEGISPTSSIGGQSDTSIEEKKGVDRNSMLSDNGIFEEKIMIPRSFVGNQVKRFSVGGDEPIPLLNVEKEAKRARERMADSERIQSIAKNFEKQEEPSMEPTENRVVPIKVKAHPYIEEKIKVMGKPKVLARDITDIYRGKMIADMTLVPQNFVERVKQEEKEAVADKSALVGWRLREYFEEGAPNVDAVMKISSQRARQRNAVGQRVDFVMGKKDVYQITQFKTAESQVSSESIIKLQEHRGSEDVPFVMATPTYGRNVPETDSTLAHEKKDEKNYQHESVTHGPTGSSRQFVKANETKRQVQSKNSNFVSHSTSSEAYIEMNENGHQAHGGGFSDFEDGMHSFRGRNNFPGLMDGNSARRNRWSDDEDFEMSKNRQIEPRRVNRDMSSRRFSDDEMDDMRSRDIRGPQWSLPHQREPRRRFSDNDSDEDSFFKGGFGKNKTSRHRLMDTDDSDFGSLRSEIRERFQNKSFFDDDDEDDWIGRSKFKSGFGSGFGSGFDRPLLGSRDDDSDFNTFPMMRPIGGGQRRERLSDGGERGQILNMRPGPSGEDVAFDIAASKSVRIRGPTGQTEIKVVSDGDEDGRWGKQNVGIVGYTLPGQPYQIDSLRAGGVKIKTKK